MEILEKIENKELVAMPSIYFDIFIKNCKDINYCTKKLIVSVNNGRHIIGTIDAMGSMELEQ